MQSGARTIVVSALVGGWVLTGVVPSYAQSAVTSTPTPATLAGLGSLTRGGISDPVVETPTQSQLQDHARRLDLAKARAASTTSLTPDNVPGSYNGLSRNVGTGLYAEPNTYSYRNYCGPGASQILISNWTTNVPNIDTLASQEKTDPNQGTYLNNMVGPINSDANTSGFYANGVANGQSTFNNWIAGDIYDFSRPAITALMTKWSYNSATIYLSGWDYSRINAAHIISIHGFNFSNPSSAGDNFYYTETAGTVAATSGTGRQTYGANKMWALVSLNNGPIW